MWACTSANVRPCPGRHRRAPSRSTTSSELQEFADRVGRVAVVEVQRDAPKQVVAGDQQAALGLEQAHVRGRVPGRLVHDPLAEVGADRHAAEQRRGRARSARRCPIRASCARRRSGAAAPPGRRSGARSPGAARTPPRDPRSCGCRCSWLGCIHTSQPARSTIVAACPQWSVCAWVHTTSRTCSRRRLHIASARSRCDIEPGWCMPVSNSTKPSPCATAHALQWGTPGHGSGRRSRNTPGSTRSPRPSSRLLEHIGHGGAD